MNIWDEYVYNGEVMVELSTSRPDRVIERITFPYRMEDEKTLVIREEYMRQFDDLCDEMCVPYCL